MGKKLVIVLLIIIALLSMVVLMNMISIAFTFGKDFVLGIPVIIGYLVKPDTQGYSTIAGLLGIIFDFMLFVIWWIPTIVSITIIVLSIKGIKDLINKKRR